ncbi:MAG: ROK family transcriptional regulator [Balneolaceae bacterium]
MSSGFLYNDKIDSTPSQNRIRVLQLIRDKKEITRADIIKGTGLSAPTVTRIVEALLEKKIIKQDELGSSNGGRPPQIIRFDSKNNFVIGIDISGTFVRAAFSNLDGEFLYEIHLPIEVERGIDGVMEQVGELIHKLLNRSNTKKERVFGIGVSICGIVNNHTGVVDYIPVFNWKNIDVKKALGKYTDLPISVGNVAHLIAQGELLYGIGKKYKSFISINLGYGIGSGIIINGEPFYGADGYSGEIGHIVVNQESEKKGREGIYGTLEALASGYGIVDIARERMEAGEVSSLSDQMETLSTTVIMKAAMNGDDLATDLINRSADYIGISIDTLIKLFNPEAITLSGGLSETGDFFIKKIRKKVASISLPLYKEEIPISVSSFGEEASLMGAFSLILQNILRLE